MIIHTNRKTGQSEVMTDRQIKSEIKELTGWSDDEYNKQYFKYRNRIRNFETITGAQTPARPNEELLRTLRRSYSGVGITAEQQAILSTSAARVGVIRAAVEEHKLSAKQNAIALAGVESIYKNMLEKTTVATANEDGETIGQEYRNWLNEIVDRKPLLDKHGAPILNEDGSPVIIEVLRRDVVLPAEAAKKLSNLARDLHRRQRAEYQANKDYYRQRKSRPGS